MVAKADDKSPYRLNYIGDGMGWITRTDDHLYGERVSGGYDACRATVKKYHQDWHRARRIASMQCPLEKFIAKFCKRARGHRVTVAEFHERFVKFLTYDRPWELEKWGKHTIRKRLNG